MIHTFSSGSFHTHRMTLSHPMSSKKEHNLNSFPISLNSLNFFIIIFFVI